MARMLKMLTNDLYAIFQEKCGDNAVEAMLVTYLDAAFLEGEGEFVTSLPLLVGKADGH